MAACCDSANRKQEESFLFYLDHLPPYFNWQKLKDVVRETTEVGYVDVPMDPCEMSKGYGWCLVKRNAEPRQLFNVLRNKFIDGIRLNVHYFNITRETAIFVDCNCTDFGFDVRYGHSSRLPNALRANHPASSPNTSPLVIALPIHPYANQPGVPQPPYSAVHTPPVSPNALVYSLQQLRSALDPAIPTQAPWIPRPPFQHVPQAMSILQAWNTRLGQAQAPAVYTVVQDGTMINTTRGLIATEATGIHVKNIPYSTKQSRLESYFSYKGCKPESCRINLDNNSNSKGSATARYATAAEAQRAVELLNGADLDGRKISVKEDINRDAICSGSGARPSRGGKNQKRDARPPMVVDGSSGRRPA